MIILMRGFLSRTMNALYPFFRIFPILLPSHFFFTGSKEAQVKLSCLRSAERTLTKTSYLAVNTVWLPIKHPKNLQKCHAKRYSENISLWIEEER